MFDRAGRSALTRIQKETGIYIWRHISHSFIRLFGPNEACEIAKGKIDEYIKLALINQKHIATIKIPPSKFSPNYRTI